MTGTGRRTAPLTPAPIATYRIQLAPEPGSRLRDVIDLLGDLGALGVSHIYLSPVTEAVPGSPHGYDVVDHRRVREELGGAEALEAVFAQAARLGLAVLIDHVPNHVSVARPDLQAAWWEMLREGTGGAAASWFDIDTEIADGRVILPVLPAPLEDVHRDGRLAVDGDRLLIDGRVVAPLAAGTEPGPLDAVLAQQHYLLTWWRDPRRNVRRFFTIDELVALEVEHARIAEVVDTLPQTWAGRPGFGGLRLDHIDGLTDPLGYLRALRTRIGETPWVLVEKILAVDEQLPEAWPVDGTTGYETARFIDQVIIDPAGAEPLNGLWASIGGSAFEEIADEARREVLDEGLRPERERAERAAAHAIGSTEVTEPVRRALRELTVALDRYRTYLPEDPLGEAALHRAATAAASRLRAESAVAAIEVLDRLVAILVDPPDDPAVRFRDRWQRLTGPAMAKGMEDRAFFRYLRLAAACEVGGDPGAFGAPVEALHRWAMQVQDRWPFTLNAGSTHDSKRSADVRARSAALTWHAAEIVDPMLAWVPQLTAFGLSAVDAVHALQTVLTCPGLDADRLEMFLVKAAREANQHTRWTEPNPDYEAAIGAVASLLGADGRPGADGLGAEVRRWAERLYEDGVDLSLGALTLQLTLPGVPDLYQGAERFCYRLTDPDNRVAPDREDLGAAVREAGNGDLASARARRVEVTRAVVITRVLALRRTLPGAFGPAARYRPCAVSGPEGVADRVVAFARTGPSAPESSAPESSAPEPSVVVVVRTWPGTTPRHADGIASMIEEVTVELPSGRWHQVLVDDRPVIEGGPVTLTSLLGSVPAAVLVNARR